MQTPGPLSPQVLTVSELNQTVALLLERTIPLCWIAGEVSNFTRASSGHWYFTLKDDQAQVRAVMFKSRSIAADFVPREGEKVEVRATATLYAPRGDYQLTVEGIRRAGLGNLYEAFLKLKQRLSEAGLFDNASKKQLPYFPTRIGIVTSPQAAALHDMLITLKRRAPHVQIILYPTPVQGKGSAQKLAEVIQFASSRAECDVLLIARGGGSIEDLWSFNDERVAHAIYACPIPTITGIGHETDFTIADFVADLRAATPTAAAEIAVLPSADLLLQIEDIALRLNRLFQRKLDQYNQTLDILSRRLVSPIVAIQNERLKLSSMQMRVQHACKTLTRHAHFRFEQIKQKLRQQAPNIAHEKNQLQRLAQHLKQNMHQQLTVQRHTLINLNAQLELLNPQRTLERGYAIILDRKGKVVKKPAQFKAPDNITVRLAEGEVELGVASVQQHL
ncbi:MAG: exodeoxyribonuclease large subunit [Solimicrobium sp.]|jgi:exodeoxyribonuclease VII large subunit|nr:exodeoxyribonuclease large subunit [Solimicrobium sp.]